LVDGWRPWLLARIAPQALLKLALASALTAQATRVLMTLLAVGWQGLLGVERLLSGAVSECLSDPSASRLLTAFVLVQHCCSDHG